MARTVNLPPGGAARNDGLVVGGWWHEDDATGRVVCDLCPRACHLKAGDRGFCFVRQNVGGELVLTTYGRSTGFCIDPIEKKPLNHFYPGTSVLSFGTAGCNLGCKFCQNWDISKSREVERLSEAATPDAIAEAAVRHGCRSVAFTYNDPVIWAEYAIDTAKACRARGVKTVAVTAGYISPEARGPFYGAMDAANVDLKSFSETFYEHVTYSHLGPVLETLRWLKAETDCWFEITNLLIPQENDSDDELRRLCGWVLEHCGDAVPVHFTAFHPDFRMRDRPPTPHETLLRAHDLARRAGLRYVYTGNVDDVRHQSTYCPSCGRVVVERNWYELGAYHIQGGACGHCGAAVAGRFDDRPGAWGRRRLPVEISRFAPTPGAPGNVSRSPVVNISPTVTAGGGAPPAVPSLDASQQRQAHAAAAELVAAAILRRPARVTDPTLAGAADLPVAGAYVTLKRRSHLRACTGTLGPLRPLAEALQHAAVHTATQDHRLPPISPTELPYLDLTVNVLHSLRPLAGRAGERLAALEVGRHGLRLQRGTAGGLLLPGVAVEHGWDAGAFLRHACRKAGLPSVAWEDDATEVLVFEALEFGGPLPEGLSRPLDSTTEPWPSVGELGRLAAHAGGVVADLASGRAPTYYAFGLPDGTVAGVALTVDGLASGGPRHLTKLALRPGVALQASVFELCESAARVVQSAGATPAFRVGVTVLTDPALHGTVADPDLRGFEPAARALLAVENEKVAWSSDPATDPKAVVAELSGRLRTRNPKQAALFSLAARSSEPSVTFDTVPRAWNTAAPRPPAVAGSFYPADPVALGELVEKGITRDTPTDPQPWAAAMVPHAGLIYSGGVAGDVFRRLAIPSRVIVIGPKHTRFGVDWAVSPHESWTIPGGSVKSDPDLIRALAEAIPGLEPDAAAHAREHAIEVELPFLARLAPQTRVVGIALAGADWEHCQRFAEGLASVVRGLDEPPLLLISSDMNHFATDEENRRLDETALRAMERLDPEHLLSTVTGHDISMCGVVPAVIVMETLRRLGGLNRMDRVSYATSADVSGDASRVVGYAGVLLN